MRNKFEHFFKNKKILVTGHTGFKGSWLTLWLVLLGAKVVGVSIGHPTKLSHFKALKLEKKINHKILDIRDSKKLNNLVKKTQPDYIFHLAAQSLVNKSYKDPILTWSSNTFGTINILNSLKFLKKKCVAIMITSDKSYKNLEIKRGYKESDLLGGHDPYSASKASAELAIQSYFKSYICKDNNIRIGIARAGNVIGGGDWSENRIIPDCFKCWSKNKKVSIRNPNSTRPWQHVIEAVYGYLLFAIKINEKKKLNGEAFNFGPNTKNNYNVKQLILILKENWKNFRWEKITNKKKVYESNLLKLNSNKAKKYLSWKTILGFKKTIFMTSKWYEEYLNKKKIWNVSKSQIYYYQKLLKR